MKLKNDNKKDNYVNLTPKEEKTMLKIVIGTCTVLAALTTPLYSYLLPDGNLLNGIQIFMTGYILLGVGIFIKVCKTKI